MIKLARPLHMQCLNGSNYFSLSFVVITPFKGHFLSSRKLVLLPNVKTCFKY